VRPNQPVSEGTLLFTLNETSLKSRVEVLSKQVAVADAELMAASQRAFDNPQSKNELAVLGSVAEQRRAELAAVTAQLKRTQVFAPEAGVAVFSDPNDWINSPTRRSRRC
jgi:multidrug resistance efflux pump